MVDAERGVGERGDHSWRIFQRWTNLETKRIGVLYSNTFRRYILWIFRAAASRTMRFCRLKAFSRHLRLKYRSHSL